MRQFVKALVLGGILSAPVLAAPPPQSPDAFITSKAKLSLWTNAGVRSTSVHVDTTEGVLTLYGKVPNEAQRELAAKVAGEVGGVKSVQNLLQVVASKDEVATTRTDKDIKDLAEKRLHADLALRDSRISVKSVDKGVVLLTGDAHTYNDHLRALAIVDRIAGVKRIASEVKTPGDFREDERVTFLVPAKPAAGKKAVVAQNTSSDTRITADVKMGLLTAPQVPSMEIRVDTDEGVVTLFGIVPTVDVKTAAGAAAAKVSGVVKVENELEVVSSAAKKAVDAKDGDVTRDLALAFKDRPDFKDVKTSVKNGTVLVSGKVSSGWDQLNALRLARTVAGVRGVENQLKVE